MSLADSIPYDSLSLAELNQAINDTDIALANPAYAYSIAGSSMTGKAQSVLEYEVLPKLKFRRALKLGMSEPEAARRYLPQTQAMFYGVSMRWL